MKHYFHASVPFVPNNHLPSQCSCLPHTTITPISGPCTRLTGPFVHKPTKPFTSNAAFPPTSAGGAIAGWSTRVEEQGGGARARGPHIIAPLATAQCHSSQRRHETQALCPCFLAQPAREVRVGVKLLGCTAEGGVELAGLHVLQQLLLPRSAALEEHHLCTRDGVDERGYA